MFERIVSALGALPPTSPNMTMERGDESPILRYLPLLVLLAIFWPVLLTLVAASVSASAWLFWLCVGSAFGVLQLAYVLYSFAMIIWDVSALTLLKTFAMLRSIVRHYYYKFGGGNSGLRGGGGKGTTARAIGGGRSGGRRSTARRVTTSIRG